MKYAIVVAEGKKLRGVFSQRQFAFDLIPEGLTMGRDNQDYAMPCNYANFCRVLREQGRAWIEGGWAIWLVKVNEDTLQKP